MNDLETMKDMLTRLNFRTADCPWRELPDNPVSPYKTVEFITFPASVLYYHFHKSDLSLARIEYKQFK